MTFLRSPEGLPLSWVGQFQDITKGKLLETQLRELADRDPLTGLFNRRRLESELSERIDRGERGALLIVDLDHFKAINDSHGHRTGDQALMEIAGALRASVRPGDLIARIGGDEFAALLPGVTADRARRAAECIREVVDGCRFDFDDQARVSASVGIANFGPAQTGAVGALLAEADAAMYRAKAMRRGGAALRDAAVPAASSAG